MAKNGRIVILSDIHYAGPRECLRGSTEFDVIHNPLLKLFVRAYRHFLWRRDPTMLNYFLDDFLEKADPADVVVANGDFSCDSAFVGVSDDASLESASECLNRLRQRFGARFFPVMGDHELGKMSLFGGVGGMRLESWRRARAGLKIEPVWELEVGNYVLLAVTSSLLALSVFEADILPEERPEWEELRREHLEQIRAALSRIRSGQRIVLFCHDPTALPFLAEDAVVQARLNDIERTIIGHLHSPLFLWKSRALAGLPPISFLGNSIRRMSSALNRARHWRPFKVDLCPALAGIQLLDDGGFYRMELDLMGRVPSQLQFFPMKRRRN